MRAAATAVLVLVVAPFLQACPAYLGDCAREEVPEFSATEEQITRNDVVAVLGEPIATIKSGDGYRVDVYEYDGHCGGLFWFLPIPYPLPVLYGTDQMLTVEYGPDDSFLTARVWPDTETPEDVIAPYKRCYSNLTEALRFSADEQFDTAEYCEQIGFPDEVSARWMCLAGHTGDNQMRRRLGMLNRDSSPATQDLIQAYKWFSLAAIAGDKSAKWSRDQLSPRMDLAQLAEAERLVAEWEPNPAECETIGAQAEN